MAKTKIVTAQDKVYDELRQAYQVRRSPSMMKLLKFFYPDLEEAEICKHTENLYTGGKPKTPEEVADECGKGVEKVRSVLEKETNYGHLKSRERAGNPGVKEYFNTGGLGLKNAWGHVRKDDAEGKAFLKIINEVIDEQAGPQYQKPRPLQIDETVDPAVNVLPLEMASEVIKTVAKAGKKIAIIYCNCREYRRKCDRRTDNCFAFGALAEYYVQLSKTIPGGHPYDFVSEEEALRRLDGAFKDGLVANLIAPYAWGRGMKRNEIPKFEEVLSICCCCSCCCEGLSRYIESGERALPEFLPVIDQEECTLCETCIDICPVKARWHNWPVKADLSDDFIALDELKCLGCGLCAYHCSTKAVKMVRARDLIPVKS